MQRQKNVRIVTSGTDLWVEYKGKNVGRVETLGGKKIYITERKKLHTLDREKGHSISKEIFPLLQIMSVTEIRILLRQEGMVKEVHIVGLPVWLTKSKNDYYGSEAQRFLALKDFDKVCE